MTQLLNTVLSPAVLRSVSDAQAHRIAPNDTNYFVLLFEPSADHIDPVCVVEIFEIGGATPPNAHRYAHEFFYVLAGEGVARCGGSTYRITKGDALMLRPGVEHVIENTGVDKLYTLTFMVPNEGFAELICAGQTVRLDDQDLAVLRGARA
jgi:mannose-6-phosphate isomerase-like protein (cupin superfamily)